jgi:HK97 family phage portal protein
VSKQRVRVKSKGKKKALPQAQKSLGYSSYGGLFGSATAIYGEADIDIQRGDFAAAVAYDTDSAVNRAVGLVADAVDSMRWRIMRNADGADTEVATSDDRTPRHPMAQAINDVFLEQGQPFLALMATSTQLYGETYVAKTTTRYGTKRGIRWLNPWWTEPQVIAGEIDYYRYGARNGTSWINIDPEYIAYYHTINPSDDLRGSSKVDAALNAINLNRYARRFTKFTFKNNARPGALVTPTVNQAGETILSEKEMNDVELGLRDNHLGTANANRVLISPRPLQVTVFEQPELDKYYSLVEILEREIFRTFGVPLAMAGDSSSSTFKDGKEVFDAFYRNTIIPLCRVIAKFINAHLMPWLDPTGKCTFEFDTSEFEDTAETDKAIADKIAVQLSGGYLLMNEARIAQGLPPLPELVGKVMIQGVPTDIERLAQPPAPALMPDISVSEPTIPQLPAHADNSGVEEDSTKDMPGVSIVLSLAKNTELISLQQDLKERYKLAGQAVTWTDPETLHLTLVSAPVADESLIEQLAAQISDYPPPALSLNIGSFAAFDSLGKHALHFRIRSNKDLEAYQKDIHALCEDLGIQTVQYSQPSNWKPHVTVGYADQRVPAITFQSRLRVAPSEVQVSVKRDGQYEVVGRVACGDAVGQEPASPITPEQFANAKHAPYVFEPHLTIEEWRKSALKELDACQTRAKKGRKFHLDLTRHLLTDDELAAITQETYAPVFDKAFAAVRYQPFEKTAGLFKAFMAQKGTLTDEQIKAWTSTRDAFSDEVLLAIADASDGTITESQFETSMRAFIADLGEEAYRDGLSDAGADPTQLDDDDYATISDLIAKQSDYIFFLADRIYTDGISAEQEAIKPDLWVNKTLVPFYQAGLAAGTTNGTFEWVLGDTEHCTDCLARGGMIKPMKSWLKDGILPQSDELECGGFNCQCKLRAVRLSPRR